MSGEHNRDIKVGRGANLDIVVRFDPPWSIL
jgi:hypothetical protein